MDDLCADFLQRLICSVGYKTAICLLSSCTALYNTTGLRIGLEGKTVSDFKLWTRFSSSRYKMRGLKLLIENGIISPLVRAPWVGSMTIIGPTTLDVLRGHPTLVKLGLYACGDVSILESCPQLETLRLERCNKAPPCAMLKCLRMHACDGLVALEKFPVLRKLQLWKCKSLTDTSALADCGALTELELIDCDGIVEIHVCPSLTSLDLRSCKHLKSVPSCPKLTTVDLGGCKNLIDIEPLARCGELTDVCLAGCKRLRHIKPLGHCGALRQLDLGGCSGVTDLSPLLACKLLTILDLARCHSLEDLSPLINCGALSYVDLRGCRRSTWVQVMGYTRSCRIYELEGQTAHTSDHCGLWRCTGNHCALSEHSCSM
jgi:hypothetical protein